MTAREEQIYREAAALWRALYGEPPPAQADGATMLDIIVTRGLPETAYDRLTTPFLRPAAIHYPKHKRT
ncbi:hypothetical protein [Phenylobacterium sp.]|uniref:hypothetical protein n=1 Tax=Phenylobacterium sp. TaxID=1871053 RepID=UPI003982F00B